jgi:hypothetical protein
MPLDERSLEFDTFGYDRLVKEFLQDRFKVVDYPGADITMNNGIEEHNISLCLVKIGQKRSEGPFLQPVSLNLQAQQLLLTNARFPGGGVYLTLYLWVTGMIPL